MSAVAQGTDAASQDALHAVYEAETHGVAAWLVVHRLKDGMSFGGFRFSNGVSGDQVAMLARNMSWKLAAHGLPVGGAKAGVCCSPDHPHIDAILADLVRAWRKPLTQHVILGKDMGASDALLDRLYEHLGQPQLGIIHIRSPDCPNRIRDLTGYVRDMTGLGAVIAAEAALGSLQGKRLLIQGAGVVGVGVAVRAAARGAVVVGLSDVNGAIISPEGLPMARNVLAARAAGQPFSLATLEDAGGARVPRDELLSQPADILFLAAGSHVVSGQLAQSIRAGIVVEASNFGLTDDANAVLAQRGIQVVPDLISSSSSAAMTSHQLAAGNRWSSDSLWEQIEGSIRTAVVDGMHYAARERVPLRDAYRAMYGSVLAQ